MFTFRNLNIFTSILSGLLFAILLFQPRIIFMLFEMSHGPSAAFIARRAAMLFLGLVVLAYSSRNSTELGAIRSISLCISTTMLSLAVLGSVEFIRGFAGVGIVPAIITETLLGVFYVRVFRKHSGKTTTVQ